MNKHIETFDKILNSEIAGQALDTECVKSFRGCLMDTGYFDAPASLSHHGTQDGDLFRHSLKVAEILVDYTNNLGLKWERSCSPWVVGLFHDLCKCDDYIRVDNKWVQNPNPLSAGHGEKSVKLLSQIVRLTEEEILCIRYHMGAYNKVRRHTASHLVGGAAICLTFSFR